MLIDWFTVIAQIVNFLILVWLMKRYLYRPILNAIDAREKRIDTQLKDAEAKKSEATKERDLFQKKTQALDESRDKMMKAAQYAADAERQKLLETARKESDDIRAKRGAALQNERVTLDRELAAGVQQEVFSIARQTLSCLANADIEAQMSKVFIERLNALDAPSKDVLTAAVKATPQSIQVRSAFALPAPQQEAIQQALKEIAGANTIAKFDVSAGLVCGIELSTNGQKLAWSIDDYLSVLDSRINNLLAPVTKESTKVDVNPETILPPQPKAGTTGQTL